MEQYFSAGGKSSLHHLDFRRAINVYFGLFIWILWYLDFSKDVIVSCPFIFQLTGLKLIMASWNYFIQLPLLVFFSPLVFFLAFYQRTNEMWLNNCEDVLAIDSFRMENNTFLWNQRVIIPDSVLPRTVNRWFQGLFPKSWDLGIILLQLCSLFSNLSSFVWIFWIQNKCK